MIYLFLADGFEEIEALAPVDLLRRAGKQVLIAGVGGKEVVSTRNIRIIADIEASEIALNNELKMIILPGGMPGTNNLEACEKVIEAIKYCAENNIYIASICAAPSILGKMGLLKGRRATCYPGYEKFLEGAKVCNTGVVADGKYITAMGAGKSVAFALRLIETLCGSDKAKEIGHSICYEEI
ncbi:MAG: DJ-1/PfpI family protein [Oscillospiraceae bacterium]|nr:DJ-1/PfpI family protein [Oscillospiraceae bacterium]